MPAPLRLAHLINPVRRPGDPSLAETQPLTFASMERAARQAAPAVQVELLTTQFAEDHPIIPPAFRRTPDLDRSVADVQPFTHPRRLPLLADLVGRLFEGSDAPYLIYTNVDIILHQDFYVEVARRIHAGLDAFIINRRRVPDGFRHVDDLPAIFATPGAPHPGFDCFVFHRAMVPKFHLARVCVGIPFIEMTFSQNLFCHARRCVLFEHDHLTFHVGMDIFKYRDPEYLAHNKREFWTAMREMWSDLDSRRFPWGDRSLPYRLWRWGLHPAIPIRLAVMLEPRRWRRSRLAQAES